MDDTMTNAHCMLGTEGYKHILRIRYTHCFSTATTVTCTGLNVTLYAHCLSFLRVFILIYLERTTTRPSPIGVKKVKQSHYRPGGFQKVEAPRFQDSRHMKVVRW